MEDGLVVGVFDDGDDAVEVLFGHGGAGWEAEAAVEQIFGNLSAHDPRILFFYRITLSNRIRGLQGSLKRNPP